MSMRACIGDRGAGVRWGGVSGGLKFIPLSDLRSHQGLPSSPLKAAESCQISISMTFPLYYSQHIPHSYIPLRPSESYSRSLRAVAERVIRRVCLHVYTCLNLKDKQQYEHSGDFDCSFL